jgi:uncharacterized repeat protein (TIGR02543 family)
MSVTIPTGSTENRIYTANWQIITYTVTFKDWNNDTISTQTINHGDNAVAPTLSERTGYTFANWDTDFTNVTQDLEVKAVYSTIDYTITYNLDGGSVTGTNPTSYNIESPAITLINPTRIGYTFLGWSGTGLTGNNNTNVTIPAESTGNRLYIAHWQIITYTVTFKDYSGTIFTETINYGEAITRPNNPVKEGCEFVGWFEDEEFKRAFNFSSIYNSDIEIYAKWLSNVDLVCVVDDNTGEITQNIPIVVGQEFETLSNLKTIYMSNKTGYTLINWSYKNLTTNQVVIITASTVFDYKAGVKITANYEANTYTVSFDLYYASSVAIAPVEVNYDDLIDFLSTPTRSGFKFLGWYIDDTTKVENGDLYKIPSNVLLRAKWEVVNFDFLWLYIGLGVVAVAILTIVILVIRKKKKYRNLAIGKNSRKV